MKDAIVREDPLHAARVLRLANASAPDLAGPSDLAAVEVRRSDLAAADCARA